MPPPLELREVLAEISDAEFDIALDLHGLASAEQLWARWHLVRGWLGGELQSADPGEFVQAAWLQLRSRVPVYRKHRHVSNWRQLPTIDRRVVARDPREFLASDLPATPLAAKTTSGTTGHPVTFLYALGWYVEQMVLTVPTILLRAGLEPFPAGVCLHVTDTPGRCGVFRPPPPMGGCAVRAVLDQTRADAWRELAGLIHRLTPATLTARPEVLAVMVAQESVLDALRGFVTAIVSSGSSLSGGVREEVEDAVGVPVIEAYGLSEFGAVASQCPECGQLHINDPRLAVEVLDHAGAFRPHGSGELVMSSTVNPAMPLLRYRTGDVVEIGDESACQRRGPGIVLTAVSGRAVPVFRFSDDSVFSPTHFTDLVKRFPLRDYQLTQVEVGLVELLIEPVYKAVAGDEALLLEVTRYITDAMGGRCRVQGSLHCFGIGKHAHFRSLL